VDAALLAATVRSSLPLRLAERLAGGRDLAGVLDLGGLAVGAVGHLVVEELAEGITGAGYPGLPKDLVLPPNG
jgi:hypothetical protein